MGKSRLLEEARARASDLGLRVLSARGTELEQGFPFGVVRQLFERQLLEADGDERDRWLAGAALAADVLTGAATSASGRRHQAQRPAIPATWQHGLYWLASNLAADSPLALWSTTCSGATRPRRARSRSSPAGSRGMLALILATRPLDPALTPERAAPLAIPPRSCCACRP